MWVKKGKRKDRTKYIGHYLRQGGERIFQLSALRKNGKVHNVVFESAQAAKKAGWTKI